jgi:signal transduction histidine kinase
LSHEAIEPAERTRGPAGIRLTGTIVIALGLMVLMGWGLEIETLKSVFRGSVSMTPNGAIAFVLLGLSLIVVSGKQRRTRLASALSLSAAGIGVVTILHYIQGSSLGPSQILFDDASRTMPYPDRMALLTAINFVLIGLSLFLAVRRRPNPRLVVTTSGVAFAGSLYAFVGYIYGTQQATGTTFYEMAIHTSLGFMVLSIGPPLVAGGIASRLLVESGSVRTILRRLLPLSAVAAIFLAWLRLVGQRAGLYGTEVGVELHVMTTVVSLVVISIIVTRGLQLAEERRTQAQVEVNQLNRDLQLKTSELEESNEGLQAFAYSVSHDLRAPLRAISGFTEILVRDYADGLEDKARGHLQRVFDNCRQMADLIDDLLEFSRLGQTAMSVGTVDVDAVVASCITELRLTHTGELEVKVGSLPACRGDEILIRQVFMNLLSNAFKYSRDSEYPRVEVKGFLNSDRDVHYEISDNGVGFDMAYSDQLFRVFQRLHRAEDYEGTGVGLALCERIVKRHSGRVWAESAPGAGATFHVLLKEEMDA